MQDTTRQAKCHIKIYPKCTSNPSALDSTVNI